MSKKDELVGELKDWDRSKENLKEYRRALLGRGTVDERTTRVEGREGYYWVRNRQDPNQVYAALGGNHPDIPGWPVIVGPHQVDNPVLRIIDSDWVQLTNLYNFSGTSSSIGAHHWQHEDYAWDMVNVGKFMIKPFRTYPALTGSPFDVIIEYDEAAYLGPRLINFELIDGYELSPLRGVRVALFTGTTVSADQYVMICLNAEANDFELIYGDAATPSGPSLSPGGYPTGAPPTAGTPATKPSLIEALANNLYPVSRVSLRRYATRLKLSDVYPLTPLYTWPGRYWATGVWMDGRGWFTGSSTVEEALIELAMRTFSGTGGSGDWKVKVSSDDTTPGYLSEKLTADDPLSVYTQNGGANESFHIVQIDPFKVMVSDDDSTRGYLEEKIVGDGDYISVYTQHDLGDDHETFVIAYSGPTIEPSLDTQQRPMVKRWFTGDGSTTTFRLGGFALIGSTQVNLNNSPQNLNFDYYESEMGSCVKFNTAPTGSTKIHVQFLQAHGGDDVNLFINPTCATGTTNDGWVLQSGTYGTSPHLSGGSINSTVTSGAATIPIMSQNIFLKSGNYGLVRSYFDRWGSGDRIEILNSGSSSQRWAYDPPIYGTNTWGREEFSLVLPRDDWYNFKFYEKNNTARYSNLRLARVSSLHPSEDTFSTDSIVTNGYFYDNTNSWVLSAGFSRVEEVGRVKLYVGGVIKSTTTNAETATQTILLDGDSYYVISFTYRNEFGGSADVRITDGASPLWTTGELNGLTAAVDHFLHFTYHNLTESDYTLELRSNNNSGVYFGGVRIYKAS